MVARKIRFLKITGLTITLLIPVLIILFLIIFGENVYSIPVFYRNGIPEDSVGCQKNGIPHRVPDFNLTDCNGVNLTEKILDDKLTIIELLSLQDEESNKKKLFQMNRVLQKYSLNKDVLWIRICYDKVDDQIKDRVQKIIESFNNVNILHAFGNREDIFDLAHCGLVLLNFRQKTPFIQVQNNTFVLVDQERRIRGYYDGTDFEEMDRLNIELDILLKE